jgi:type IV pilus assembly protein PilA
MIVVAIIGLLAAIAIPSFMKYIRKSRTAEAAQMLEKITNGARTYYLEEHGGAQLTPIPSQFPATVAVTPAVTCCNAGVQRCTPDATLWDDPSWRALKFSVDDPHYYRYEFTSSGVSTTSKFTARAFGDLDCDGVYSTFSTQGEVLFQGNDITAGGGIARVKELE